MAKRKQIDYRARQAQRRNQEEAAYRKKVQERKAFMDKYQKQIIIGAVAVVLAVLLIWLGVKFFVGPGGSIPNFFGTLRGVESNWIVANTGTSRDPKYFKMGEFNAPEGYLIDPEYVPVTDELAQGHYFYTDDENATAYSVFVCGVPGGSASAQVDRVLSYSYYTNVSRGTVDLNGSEAHYGYYTYDESQEGTPDEDKTGFASVCIYADTVQDSSVLMLVTSPSGSLNEAPTEEEMLAAATQFFPLLTVEK